MVKLDCFLEIQKNCSSRAMDDRNKLFRKVHKLLMNEGASHEEARQLVKEELRRGPGGGGDSHPPPPSHETGR